MDPNRAVLYPISLPSGLTYSCLLFFWGFVNNHILPLHIVKAGCRGFEPPVHIWKYDRQEVSLCLKKIHSFSMLWAGVVWKIFNVQTQNFALDSPDVGYLRFLFAAVSFGWFYASETPFKILREIMLLDICLCSYFFLIPLKVLVPNVCSQGCGSSKAVLNSTCSPPHPPKWPPQGGCGPPDGRFFGGGGFGGGREYWKWAFFSSRRILNLFYPFSAGSVIDGGGGKLKPNNPTLL